MKNNANNGEEELNTATEVREALLALADPARAEHHQRFFRTGVGEYGEGDVFWGLTTPLVRSVVRHARHVRFAELEVLLADPVHEVRACAAGIVVWRFEHARSEEERQSIIDFYLGHTAGLNNWDLVDTSCGILGTWLLDRERSILYRLAESKNMWEQRIAMVSTSVLIRHGQLADALKLAEMLLNHPHDLLHKAVGWMLREVGKKDKAALESFLARYAATMPRVALRYSIEKMTPEERKYWMLLGERQKRS